MSLSADQYARLAALADGLDNPRSRQGAADIRALLARVTALAAERNAIRAERDMWRDRAVGWTDAEVVRHDG